MNKLYAIRIKTSQNIMYPKFISGVFIAFVFLLYFSKNLLAFQDIDALTSSDQRFTTAYKTEVFAETFHQKEVLSDKPIVDEVKKQPIDSWRYYRTYKSSVSHDSNYFAAPRDPKGETIYSYKPTVGMSHRTRATFIAMSYELTYNDYVQNDKLSRFTNVQQTDLRYNFNRLKITINNIFIPDTVFVHSDGTGLHTTDGKRVVTYADTANINLDYKYSPKTTLSYSYKNALFYFPRTNNISSDNATQDTMTHTFSPKISYRLTPKTSIFIDHKYMILDYYKSTNPGTYENDVDIGINGKIFSNIGVSISVGYNYVENPEPAKPIGGLNIQAALSKKIMPKVQATLSATHQSTPILSLVPFQSTPEQLSPEQSRLVQSNLMKSDTYGINLTWQATHHIQIDAEASAEYTAKDGYITLPDMDNPTNLFTRPREDQIYKWGLRLTWTPRPLFNLVLAYEFNNTNSSFKDFEYYSDRFTGYLISKF